MDIAGSSVHCINRPICENKCFSPLFLSLCFHAEHCLVLTDSGKSQNMAQTKLRREEGSKKEKGAEPEHNLETMWHSFPFSAHTGAYPVSQLADIQ